MKLMDEVMLQEKRMIADRRYLHENPELSNQEYHTTEFIRKRLQEFGVEIENLNLKTADCRCTEYQKRSYLFYSRRK